MDEFDQAAANWRSARGHGPRQVSSRPRIERIVWLACLAIGVTIASSVARSWPADLSAGEVCGLLALTVMGAWTVADRIGLLEPEEWNVWWRADRWRLASFVGLALLVVGLGFAVLLPIWVKGRYHQLALTAVAVGEFFLQRHRRWLRGD